MEEGVAQDAPNILVIGGAGSGKSSLIRLLLGKQSIGESKDFCLHTGLMGHNNRLVKIIECPPRRQELLEAYTEKMQGAVRGLHAPVTCVLVVIKQAMVGGGGFQLNKERNIPLDELRAAFSVMGNKFKTCIHVVFTNWSRQFNRLNERLKRGITEESAQNKIANEFQRNLNITKISCYFMDTVFWRTEQRTVEKGAMTTLQSSYFLAGAIFKEPYDPVSNTSTPKTEQRFTNKKPPSAPKYKPQYQDYSDSSDSDSPSAQRLNKWKGKKFQNLAEDNDNIDALNSLEKQNGHNENGRSSIKVPIQRDDHFGGFQDQIVRAVPARVIESPTTNKSFTKHNVNEFVESKVKEMMRDEGVVLDFTEAKLNGKIITKTKIIKEIVGKDGNIEYVEEEEVDESLFGPDLDNNVANTSTNSETSSKIQRDIINSSKPIYNLGSPVVSTTFDRKNKLYRSSYTQYENYNTSTVSSSESGEESDGNQVIVAEKTPKHDDPTQFHFNAQTTSISNSTVTQTNTFESSTLVQNISSISNSHQDRNIEIQLENRSRSISSSSSSDMTEALDEAISQVQGQDDYVQVEKNPTHLNNYQSKVVILGDQNTIRAMSNTLMKLGAQNILGCPISYEGGVLQYEDLLQSLSVGDEVIFVWAIETRTGDVDDDLIGVFKDFLNIFAAESIKSMIVILWYPGSLDDLRESIEDLTEIVKKNYHYNSPLGFPVLQFSPDEQFSVSVVKTMYDVQPFKITNISISHTNTETINKEVAKTTDIEVVSTEHVYVNQDDTSEEVAVDVDDLENVEYAPVVGPPSVDDPVVLVVGPPGHGKSSVGNLVLGGDYFQVRDTDLLQSASRVHSDYLQKNQAYVTVLEAPGFYKDNFDTESREIIEQEIKKIGHVTHVVVVWHALELREEEMDYVLKEVHNIFGKEVFDHLIFAVTYFDSGTKAKKYRSKRGVSYDSLTAMISDKVKRVFDSEENPLIYFLCSKQCKDSTRKHLVQYLNSDQWKILPASKMSKWTNTDSSAPEPPDVEDNYEEVEEEVFHPDNSLQDTSKSLHNLSALPPPSSHNLSSNKDLSKSLHSVPDDIPPNRTQSGRGRGRLFSSNIGKRTTSTSSSNIGKRAMSGTGSRGRGKSRSQSNLFGGRSRSRSNSRSNLEMRESQSELNQAPAPSDKETNDLSLTRERSSSRGRAPARRGNQINLFGTKPRSRSRSNTRKSKSNLAVNESKTNLQEESEVQKSSNAPPAQASAPREDSGEGTLPTPTPGPRQRPRSAGSMSTLTRPRRGRSKSRDRARRRPQPASRQSSSLPRPRPRSQVEEAGEQQRPPMRRSKSNWSLRSSNYRRRRKSGDCSII